MTPRPSRYFPPLVEGRPPRQYRNGPEDECIRRLTDAGWTATKRGWPDFIAWRDGLVVCIEVKAKVTHGLKQVQAQVMRILAAGGIRCYRWDPVGGFERIRPDSTTRKERLDAMRLNLTPGVVDAPRRSDHETPRQSKAQTKKLASHCVKGAEIGVARADRRS